MGIRRRTPQFVHPISQARGTATSPTGERNSRVLDVQDPGLATLQEETTGHVPSGRASGPELLGPEAIFPPVMTVVEVARLLRMNVDTVRRIDRSELAPAVTGVGKWALYLLEDVLAYVRRLAQAESRELNFKGRRELIDQIAGSARGRSRKGTSL